MAKEGRAVSRKRPTEVVAATGDLLTVKQRAFLASYAECGNLTYAAECAGVEARTHHGEWKHDPVYWAAFEAAHEMAIDRLEFEARRRAVEGVKEPVFHRGRLVGHVTKHSDALLMFLLKAERRQKFAPAREGLAEGPLLVALPKAYVGVDLEKI